MSTKKTTAKKAPQATKTATGKNAEPKAKMTNSNQPLVDAIREVAASVQKAIADGYRSRMIDADDLVEVLLAIADRLDPPVRGATNEVVVPCPDCGLADPDRLVWQDDQFVRCDACGTIYAPRG